MLSWACKEGWFPGTKRKWKPKTEQSQHWNCCVPAVKVCLREPWLRLQWLCGSLAKVSYAVQDGKWVPPWTSDLQRATSTIKNKWIRKIYTIPKSRRQEHLFNSTWPLEKINLPWELVTPDLISHRFGNQMYIAFTIRKSPTLRIKLKWVLIKNTWGILA